MKKTLLTEAVNMARKKLSNHPQGGWPHFSFIVQNNKIIGYGINQDGEPLIHWGYKQNKLDPSYNPKIHSEIHSYRKNKSLINKESPFEIINIRLNASGELRNSKPCKCCFNLLTELGCKKFYYSSDCGFLTQC
jgi:tRNA(Arg) A34 adenosine deaminase TadA